MMTAIYVTHFLVALLVIAESLNKLERADPTAPGLAHDVRILAVLKVAAWLLMAFGAICVVLSTLFQPDQFPLLERPSLREAVFMLGFAVLIIRTRIKEG
jgi:hypothetical protein